MPSEIRLSFDIDAPLSTVWELGIHPARIPEWQFDVVSVGSAPDRIQSAGQSYHLVYHRFGRDLSSPVRVSRFEPLRLVETFGKTPLGGFFKSQTVMTAVGSGTHVDWKMVYRLPGWFVGTLMDMLVFRRAFARTVEKYNLNFKAIAEGKAPVVRVARDSDRSRGQLAT